MKEEFLHYIWRYQLYNKGDLLTTEGQSLQIIEPGTLNEQAGPDFHLSKVKINQVEWVGNIEIHWKSSDWFTHGHQNDKGYDNVILHVVYEHDRRDLNIPTVELKSRISKSLWNNFEHLKTNRNEIPCESLVHVVPDFEWKMYKQRLLSERLELKIKRIEMSYEDASKNWNQVFYEQMAYNLGLSSNAEAMQKLARRVSLTLIHKHRNSLLQVESLLFGVAGFLGNENKGIYPTQLRTEYLFLKNKYNLQEMNLVEWNFGRVRPPSFPTIRIAQFASLLIHSHGLFSELMKLRTNEEITNLLQVATSSYWEKHYRFEDNARHAIKRIGKSMIQSIVINSIVPFLFLVGGRLNKPELQEHAIKLLESLPAEKHKITRIWQRLHVQNKNAFDSQALVHLYKSYCMVQNCLSCRIGHQILRKKRNLAK